MGCHVINPQNYNFNKFQHGKFLMLSKCYESTEVERRTWLHVPLGKLWSTSSEPHQVVEVMCACQIYEGSICHRLNV